MPWHKDNVIVKPNVRHWSKEDNKRFAEQYVWMPISELAKLISRSINGRSQSESMADGH